MERTPRARIKGMLRQIFLRSNERSECLKRDKYTCQTCKRKQSKAKGKELKVEVHHVKGIHVWDEIIDKINEYLLCDIEGLQTLCKDCHNDIR